jgi:hypothetical protein
LNIFAIRRRDALSSLKLPESQFAPLPAVEGEAIPDYEPVDPVDVSPANELVTELVALDIAAAVRTEHPSSSPSEMAAPLSRRHLDTIDRMVAHFKDDEQRLERQIEEATRQLADTRLSRHVFERNSADLRQGLAVLTRAAQAKASPRRPPQLTHSSASTTLQLSQHSGGEAPQSKHRRHKMRPSDAAALTESLGDNHLPPVPNATAH